MCKEYGSLPFEGGVLDQPAYLIHGLSGVLAAVGEKQSQDMKRARAEAEAAKAKAKYT